VEPGIVSYSGGSVMTEFGRPVSMTFGTEPVTFPAPPWSWHGPPAVVTGPAWGGSLEIVDFHLRAGRYLLPERSYDGCVLFLETSEELPLAAAGEYHPSAPLVFGVDFGHTEPQHVISSGGTVTVDAVTQRIEVTY
jgi:muramoyltetrapeptide carboxypeptidase LdcA involved in peptidoglycan recycling